ncbi:pregnancy-associated plasma protein-A [Chitinophaga skermanii]|uniref:Pregnancy-associated plasma protein-A n=1 Tax=Chitinophaga skermanii TaxID=331697 RepID=A0A327Q745_9BACT|nr:zinc metalloprotease [Chitinophaga skermanii]RAJ00406.1 pregnancy-associated plasma protein-A [Chitinophaga skermanii]
MKYLSIILVLGGTLLFASCDKSAKPEPRVDGIEPVAITQRNCGSMTVLNDQLRNDPNMASRMSAIESLTRKVSANPAMLRLLPNGSIEIPVVVNVLYRTATENISLAQIQSQIDVLNEDFNATNPEIPPSPFTSLKANVGISFSLKAVVRKSTTKTSWGTNNQMKSTTTGGINATTPDSVLNIWVVGAMTGGVIGYAQFPGGASATDGVVIAQNCFGRVGTAAAPFGKGRTATHEVGHWLNLRHIWGDATCGNDFCGDTPTHNAANFGCPTHPHLSTCAGTPIEMTMNYMDYSDDACLYMFTPDQRTRMLATFLTGGGRTLFAL